jgi:small subunit ribosomal protein S3Ae
MANKKGSTDTWKKKKWFEIFADKTFDEKLIGETVAIASKNLVDRKIKKTLNELTGNIRDSYYELTFRITKVTATKADTALYCFEAKAGYLRRLIRKQRSKIEPVFYATTKDGHKLKIKALFISGRKYSTPLRTEARKIIINTIQEEISTKTVYESWHDLIFPVIAEKTKANLKKLGFVNKVLISKTKLME